MKPQHRRTLVFAVAAFALGGLVNLLLGPSPGAATPQPQAEAEWRLRGAEVPDMAALDAGWETRAPWGAAPKPVEAAAAPPPPPPAPVGIVRGRQGRQEVIFLAADVGTVRVAPGESLPDGGRLLRVSGMRVTWVDGDAQEQQRAQVSDPPRVLPGVAPSAGIGSAMRGPASQDAAAARALPPALANMLGGAGPVPRPGGTVASPRGSRGGSSSASAPEAAPSAAQSPPASPPASSGSGTVTTVSAKSLRRSPPGQSNRAATTPSSAGKPPPGGLLLPPGNNPRPPANSQNDRPQRR